MAVLGENVFSNAHARLLRAAGSGDDAVAVCACGRVRLGECLTCASLSSALLLRLGLLFASPFMLSSGRALSPVRRPGKQQPRAAACRRTCLTGASIPAWIYVNELSVWAAPHEAALAWCHRSDCCRGCVCLIPRCPHSHQLYSRADWPVLTFDMIYTRIAFWQRASTWHRTLIRRRSLFT
jgi:hypothetical protein